jgi:hypothetical protein
MKAPVGLEADRNTNSNNDKSVQTPLKSPVQGGAVVARQAHNLKAAGSNPASASNQKNLNTFHQHRILPPAR